MSGDHNKYCSANNTNLLADYIKAIIDNCEDVQQQNNQGYYNVVDKPKHYMLFEEYGIEVRDVMELLAGQLDDAGYSGMLVSDYIQAMQYLMRWHNKNGLEDIKKAQFYLNKIVEQLDPENIL